MNEKALLDAIFRAYSPTVDFCAVLLLLLGLVALFAPERFRGILRALNATWRLRAIGVLLIIIGVEMIAGSYFGGERTLPQWWDPYSGILVHDPVIGHLLGILTAAKGVLYVCAPRLVKRIIDSHVSGSAGRLRFLGIVCLGFAVLFFAVARAEIVCPFPTPA